VGWPSSAAARQAGGVAGVSAPPVSSATQPTVRTAPRGPCHLGKTTHQGPPPSLTLLLLALVAPLPPLVLCRVCLPPSTPSIGCAPWLPLRPTPPPPAPPGPLPVALPGSPPSPLRPRLPTAAPRLAAPAGTGSLVGWLPAHGRLACCWVWGVGRGSCPRLPHRRERPQR